MSSRACSMGRPLRRSRSRMANSDFRGSAMCSATGATDCATEAPVRRFDAIRGMASPSCSSKRPCSVPRFSLTQIGNAAMPSGSAASAPAAEPVARISTEGAKAITAQSCAASETDSWGAAPWHTRRSVPTSRFPPASSVGFSGMGPVSARSRSTRSFLAVRNRTIPINTAGSAGMRAAGVICPLIDGTRSRRRRIRRARRASRGAPG